MIQEKVDPCIDVGDTAWVLTATLLVLVMIPGLALFEAGLLRPTNTVSILTQVISGCVMMCVLWYVIGFTLVYGKSISGIIGSPATYPILQNVPHTSCLPGQSIPGIAYASFQMMFASITPLLMTGAFAERLRWNAYVCFILVWELVVYYPVAHWIWNDEGWLAKKGALDFAGGIVIHVTAGVGAIVAAILVHPRFDFKRNRGHFEPSNIALACVGGGFLWMGWFGFNAGSALTSSYVAATTVASTQLASSSCACIWLMLAWIKGKPNIEDVLNGAIAGLAGVTPAAGYISPSAALVLGIVLGFASFFSVDIIKFRFHIDDALDVSSVHGVPGLVGALAIGICADNVMNPLVEHQGAMNGGTAYLLGVQTLSVVVAGAWSGFWTWLILKCIHVVFPLSTKHMANHGQVDAEGLDCLDHDCEAYGFLSHSWTSDAASGRYPSDYGTLINYSRSRRNSRLAVGEASE